MSSHRVDSPPAGSRRSSGTATMRQATALQTSQPVAPAMADDLHLAEPGTDLREFACLSCVTSLRPGDSRVLRRIAGVTGVIADDDAADVHLIVAAPSRQSARREAVARVAELLPHAVVTVPSVVDYDSALLSHLELQGCDFDDWAVFDDCVAVAGALDRR